MAVSGHTQFHFDGEIDFTYSQFERKNHEKNLESKISNENLSDGTDMLSSITPMCVLFISLISSRVIFFIFELYLKMWCNLEKKTRKFDFKDPP